MSEIVFDIESYWNVFLVGLKRLSDGKTHILEQSHRSTIDRDWLRRVLLGNTMIGFNSMSYDAPVLWNFLETGSVEQAKRDTNAIIKGGLRYWEVEEAIGVSIPWDFKRNHCDLIEPQPNPFASLKILHARMHGHRLRDLPYDPEQRLSDDEIDQLRDYLEHSDLPATEKLWHALEEPMALRRHVSDTIGTDVMSKSDTQLGLAIIKKRAEDILGKKIGKPQVRAGQTFRYKAPAYIQFHDPALQEILRKIQSHDFIIGIDGKVDFPEFLAKPITFAGVEYSMGIGGLHSTESNRAVKSTNSHVLVDWDVASYYPAIILTLGLYPEAIGPEALTVYRGIRDDRVKSKKMAKDKSLPPEIIAKAKAEDKGLKVSLNGFFGSLGSKFSFVYAPHLMIAVTLTGQLALLMLIERGERLGIPAVSANTDGVVFWCPREKWAGLQGERPLPSPLADLIEGWERDTGFVLEGNEYRAVYSQSVNSYFALKADGGHKRKGPLANPWSKDPNDYDARAALMKNPQMTICSDAALARIKHGTPLRETIEACTDIRQFITVIKVTAGATWRDKYLGKTIRYYYSTDGAPIYEAKANEKTGNFKKVPKTDGAAECMTLPDRLPADIDYDRYVAEAEDILKDLGFYGEVAPPERRIRLTKLNREKVLAVWMVQP